MKKTLLLLLSVIVISGVFYLITPDEQPDKRQPHDETQKTDNLHSFEAHKEEFTAAPSTSQEDDGISNDENLGCAEKLSKEFPDASEQYDQVVYEIFLTKEEMMGTDEYASLDRQSLKALAYANDIKAILYYSEKIISESQNTKNNSGPEKGAETIDYKTFDEGIELQWRLAVRARSAFMSTIADHYMSLAGNQLNQGESLDKIINSLAQAKAYIWLTERIFEKDPHIRRVLSNSEYFEERVEKELGSRDNYNELTKDISEQAVKIYQELVQKWEKARNFHGLQIYPDYYTKEVEEFAQRLEEQCWYQ